VYQSIYSITRPGGQYVLVHSAQARVGLDAGDDRRRGFVVSDGGITCVRFSTIVEGGVAASTPCG
jgi:hypothetical protein